MKRKKGKKKKYLQLGLGTGLVLGRLEDRVELGSHHDVTLDLNLSRHEELLSVGLAVGKIDKVLIDNVNDDVGLELVNGSLVHGTGAVLQVKSPGGDLAVLVLDVELEDTLDLADLLLALGLGEGLELLVNLGEDSRGLETFDDKSCKRGKKRKKKRVIILSKSTWRGCTNGSIHTTSPMKTLLLLLLLLQACCSGYRSQAVVVVVTRQRSNPLVLASCASTFSLLSWL